MLRTHPARSTTRARALPDGGRRPVASITSASAWAVTSAKSSSSRASVAASMVGRQLGAGPANVWCPTQVATRSATSHDTGLCSHRQCTERGPVVIRPTDRAGIRQAVTVSAQAIFRPRSRGAEPASCW